MDLPQKTKRKKIFKIHPIIIKKGHKYYYNLKFLYKKKSKRKAPQKQNILPQIKQSQSPQLFAQKRFNCPILFTQVIPPVYKMPEYLDVSIHEGFVIDYKQQNLFYRVPTQQVLSQNQQNTQLNISAPQMELNQEQYQVPKIVLDYGKSVNKVNLWVYCGYRQTQWHYDGHDNFLYVLKGKKIIYLAKPEQIQANNLFSLYNNHAEEHQQINQNNFQVVSVTQGTCLFIPQGWWHKVQSFGNPNIALNFWVNSVSQVTDSLSLTQKNMLLKHLIFELSEQKCKKKIANWEQLPQQKKQHIRRLVFIECASERELFFS